MVLFEKKDFSTWNLYEGFAEGSGRSEKQWLQSPDGKIGLFKWPKTDPVTGHTTYEHISEHLAHQIGNIVGVPTANVEIGEYDSRIGSMSYLVNGSNEELREGAWFLLGKHPFYDLNTLQDTATGKYYSIEHIFEITSNEFIRGFWIDMMLFDFLIGNRDRHQNNWAFLLPIEDKEKTVIRVRPCPLYDNGSSLCCYINDSQIDEYLGKDRNRIFSLVDSKSRSIIRIDPTTKKQPLHSEVVRYLTNNYPSAIETTERFITSLNKQRIVELIYAYPDDLLPQTRKKLIILFLEEKVKLLRKIREEALDEQ